MAAPVLPTTRVVETHVSTLLFLDGLVYKRKKALDLGFVDFRDRASRRRACQEEVRLNRRLSPDVYLGVAEVLGVDGAPCESLVVMREMPPQTRLASLVADGHDVQAPLEVIASLLARLHGKSPAPDRLRSVATASGLLDLWEQGTRASRQLTHILDAGVTERIGLLARSWLVGRESLLLSRQHRVVDGHGDLLADDVFLLPDGPRILDCLEFDERLRICDGLSDAAFLAMDLERLGAPALARQFLDAYRRDARDLAPAGLEDHYLAYRAHVRSKVTALRAVQQGAPEIPQQARDLAALSLAHLERAHVRLVVVGGLPGSGKTTLARELAAQRPWLSLSSDEVRATLQVSQDRAGFAEGKYSAEATARTYKALFARAQAALAEGVSVVLDASFIDPHQRAQARVIARQSGASLTEVHCTVEPALAEARIKTRAPGPSDATPTVRRLMAAREASWPEATQVDTASVNAEALLAALSLVGPLDDTRLVGPPASQRRTYPPTEAPGLPKG